MAKVPIVDDEAVRIERITRFARTMSADEPLEVEHRTTLPESLAGFDVIFLDHDLGPGGDVYDHLRRREGFPELEHTIVVVHSMNPVGAQNIAALLRPYARKCLTRPYSSL